MKVKRLLTNICSDNLQKSMEFYTKLFDFQVDFESEWFIHLISKDIGLELGLMDRKHEIVPKAFQHKPQGVYLTFVVENVDELFEKVKEENFKVIEAPVDTFYGQRRLLIVDPDGALIDISSPIPNFSF